jgi:Type II secretion system (T2SS), protein G
MVPAMSLRKLAPALMLLTSLACESEDPRLPENLLKEAQKMNVAGKGPEAKAMMSDLIARYPDSEASQQARKDLFFIDAMINRDMQDRQRQVKTQIKRITDALIRYHAKVGEYPESLADLTPEYLEQVPQTPWNHPFLYKAYVSNPIATVTQRRGPARQFFNTKLDGYYLACLGTDLQVGGEGLATDILIKDGQPWLEKAFPPLPQPQPLR